MKVVTISTQKGGTGKTSLALALSAGLEQRGYKVLLVDSDPQCNATFSSGIDPAGDHLTLFDLYEKTDAAEIIQRTPVGYDIIPGSLLLTTADLRYSGRPNREYVLRRGLRPILNDYDFVVCDSPPQIGLLVENLLVVTDDIIIPLTADAFSIQGLMQYTDLLDQLKDDFENLHFSIAGIVLSRYSDRTNISRTLTDTIHNLAEQLDTKVFKTKIREGVAVRDAALARQDIFTSQPKAKVTNDFNNFIDEYLEG